MYYVLYTSPFTVGGWYNCQISSMHILYVTTNYILNGCQIKSVAIGEDLAKVDPIFQNQTHLLFYCKFVISHLPYLV